jgi:hypothetical protein
VAGVTGEASRDAVAAGVRGAARFVLLALPFSLTMRRSPADVHVSAAAAG